MSDGINIEQRSIVLMPFPYSDLSGSKKRPALVVSSTEFNKSNEDIICCLITSNLEDKQHSITISNKDVESGFLEFESKIKAYRMFTINRRLIYRFLCRLNSQKFKLVLKEIEKIIGL